MNVSVIMTVKNGEKFIEQAISSVIGQVHTVAELVVVDDGSTDRTVSLIEELKHQVNIPIQLLRTAGVGRARALNMAIKVASGEWIANLDVDDLWYPDKVAMQIEAGKQFASHKIFITGSRLFYGAQERMVPESFEGLRIKLLNKKDFYIRNPVNHSSVMIHRCALLKVGLYNEELNRQIDADLWARLLKAGYEFCQIDLPLTVKRIHTGQSYEGRNRLGYAYGSMISTYKKLVLLEAPVQYYIVPLFKFIYNISPRWVGHVFRKSLRSDI